MSGALQGGVVKVGIQAAVHDLVGHGRGLGGVTGVEADRALLDPFEHVEQAVDVHRLAQAVLDGLADERVVGDLEGAGHVLLAPDLRREDGGEQVVGAEPLNERRDALAASLARDGEGARGIPAPARGEERGVQDRLLDGLLRVPRAHE